MWNIIDVRKERYPLSLGAVSATLGLTKTFSNRDKLVVLLTLDVGDDPRDQLLGSLLVDIVVKSNVAMRVSLGIVLNDILVVLLFVREAGNIAVSPIVAVDIPENGSVTELTESLEGGGVVRTSGRTHVGGVLANDGTEDLFKLLHFRLDLGSTLTTELKMAVGVRGKLMARVVNVLDNLLVSLGTSRGLYGLSVDITTDTKKKR